MCISVKKMEIALKNRRKTANSKEQYRLSRAGKLWILNAGDKIVGIPLELRKDDSLELHENFLTTAKGDMYQIHNGHGYISLKEIHVASIESSLNSSAGNKTTHQEDLVDVSKNKDISKRDADSKSINSAYDKTNVVSEVSGRNVSETSCVVKVPVAGDEICSHGQVSGRRQLDDDAHGEETASDGVVTASVVKYMETRDYKDGSNKVQYMINDTLNVFIYTMYVTDLKDVEAIVCTVKPDLQGGRLAEAIAQIGGSKYTKELEKRRTNNAPLRDGQVFLCKEVGKLRVKAVLHLVAEFTVQDTSQRSMEYLSGLNRSVLEGATYHKIKKLAMSPIGAGYYIKAQRDIATLCSGLASDIIDLCLDSKEKRTLTELHLVNLDSSMTQALQTEFHNRSQGIDPHPRSEFSQTGEYGGGEGRRDYGGGGGGYRQFGDERNRWRIPTTADYWIEHKPLPEVSSKLASVVQKNSMKETKAAASSRDLSKSTKLKCSVCDNAPKEQLPCGHSFCNVCSVTLKINKACYICKAKSNKAHSKSVSKGASKSVAASGDKDCPICTEPLLNTHVLPCEHELCKTCLGKLQEPKCPFCGFIFGIFTGTQPNGQMFYRYKKYHLLGYEKDGTIEIVFQFKDGKQGDEHPNPGKPYKGTQRFGYLPDNEEGVKVLSLMRRAFDRRLMFTIGDSVTTGKGDRVTYNDIHLKTTPDKGKYGYPDPMYLRRVQEELASKGITE